MSRLFSLFLFAVSALVLADEVQLWYSESSPWTPTPGGYSGTVRTAPAKGASSPETFASWVIAVPKPGVSYTIQATWVPVNGSASNAIYRIYDGDKLVRSATINQRVPPVGETVKSAIFQDLGSITPVNSTIRVVLSNHANGVVVADTVRLK